MKRCVLLWLAGFLLAALTAVASPAYRWISVSMGGGGAIPGIVLHPRVPDVAYIHTDVGGAYRWDAGKQSWVPLMEAIPCKEWNLYGVDSIAVDPNDATGNIVYISTGKYTEAWAKTYGMVMKSSDRGATWKRLSLSPTGGSNSDQECGERLAVDPHNSNHIVYAARMGGFFSSMDAGVTWTHVAAAPSGAAPDGKDKRGSGLCFAVFDASSGTVGAPGCTRVIYIGASNDGVYMTNDGGGTWRRLEGGPARSRKAVMGPDGSLVVSHATGVARLAAGQWVDITPPKKDGGGGCAVAIDPNDPGRILATLGGGHKTPVFLSTDSGKTWRDVSGQRNPTRKWWPGWCWFSNPFSIAFDPFHRNQVWATDWYGTYHTPDITAASPVWTNRVDGIEEIVTAGALVAPETGKYRLFSGSADIGGLDHESLTEPPATGIWVKGLAAGLARTGIAVKGNLIATVGTHNWSEPGSGGYSLDGGDTWKTFRALPYDGIMGGRVAITGTGRRILWVPQGRQPYYSDDLGDTWTPVKCAENLAGTARGNTIFTFDQPLAVDGADPSRVYLLHDHELLLSTDAGATFVLVTPNAPDDWIHKIATSGKANDVWVSIADKGLYRSKDGGVTFAREANVQTADLFCFGKAAAGRTFPALFVKGTVNGTDGYFRSDDEGATWIQIDLPNERIGNDPNTMTGDWRVFGGVFVGTNGRGIYYGRPEP